MVEPVPPRLKQVLSEKIADSICSPLPQLTPRRVLGAIQLPGKATAVVGMRRAGKTTYLHQLRGEKAASGQDREQLPYLNFEDERLAGLSAGHLGAIVEEYERRFPDASETSSVTWCFEREIQLVPGWERFFVRRLLDTGGTEIFVTGSSAALLSREIATALRARAWEVLLHPFSFEEALTSPGARNPCGTRVSWTS